MQTVYHEIHYRIITDLTDARMDHDASPVSLTSVSAELALLAYQGMEISNSEESQTSHREDFALAVPKEISPFTGTEKDGELVMLHPKKNPVSHNIWLDLGTLRYLRDKTFEDGASAQERDRVQRRAKGYYSMNNLLRKRTSPTAGRFDKVVPPPKDRVNLICAIHIKVGHFGVHETFSLLEPTYFWSGMFAQVRKEVLSCTVCNRVKANFEVKDPTLNHCQSWECFIGEMSTCARCRLSWCRATGMWW
jgi:hypothetical protein